MFVPLALFANSDVQFSYATLAPFLEKTVHLYSSLQIFTHLFYVFMFFNVSGLVTLFMCVFVCVNFT